MSSGLLNSRSLPRGLALALCVAPLIVAADLAWQRPAAVLPVEVADADRPSPPDGILERPRERALRGEHPRLNEEDVEKDWPAAEKFLRETCPNRAASLARMNPGPKLFIKRQVVSLWRTVNHDLTISPKLYDTHIHELKVEDEVFGICVELKHGGNKTALQQKLRAKLRTLFELGLDERKQRIDLLSEAIDVQKKNYEEDKSRIDQIVEERFHAVSTEGVPGAWLDGFGKRGASKSKSVPDSQPDDVVAPQ